LSDYFDQDPSQIKLILENLSHRLRDLTDDYTEVCKTISEMRATRGETASRKEGLLSRISKFLNVYNHLLGSRNALEAMERYEEIEQARESHGQMRENLRFKKGQVIFRQGDAGDCMYYIGYGTVGIYTDYGTENELLLTELHENQFFGEMGLIEKLPRSATAVVLENDTVLTRLTEDGLDQMFEEKPAFILLTLQHISSRLRSLTRDYVKACETIAKMHEEEKGGDALSPEDEDMINYYIALAQSQNNRWMFY
jgi:CRP-like cAMP-binding protein